MNIEDLSGIQILYDAPISKYTFTKVGGKVDVLAFPKNKEEIQILLKMCQTQNLDWIAIGNASNIIILDGGFKGLVIMLTKMNTIKITNNKVIVEAGATLKKVTREAWKSGLTGLEFACGIPGSIGGAVYMNAGAYGGEIADVLLSVDVIDDKGNMYTYSKEKLQLSYRYSKIQDSKVIIVAATFGLQKGNANQIKERMDHLTILRESKQPLEYPSCGSVFKRPPGYYTGQLIQEAGLQGKRIGGAQISTKHAGFIVNVEKATARDYLDLIAYIQKEIYTKYQVQLETEVRIIGEE